MSSEGIPVAQQKNVLAAYKDALQPFIAFEQTAPLAWWRSQTYANLTQQWSEAFPDLKTLSVEEREKQLLVHLEAEVKNYDSPPNLAYYLWSLLRWFFNIGDVVWKSDYLKLRAIQTQAKTINGLLEEKNRPSQPVLLQQCVESASMQNSLATLTSPTAWQAQWTHLRHAGQEYQYQLIYQLAQNNNDPLTMEGSDVHLLGELWTRRKISAANSKRSSARQGAEEIYFLCFFGLDPKKSFTAAELGQAYDAGLSHYVGMLSAAGSLQQTESISELRQQAFARLRAILDRLDPFMQNLKKELAQNPQKIMWQANTNLLRHGPPVSWKQSEEDATFLRTIGSQIKTIAFPETAPKSPDMPMLGGKDRDSKSASPRVVLIDEQGGATNPTKSAEDSRTQDMKDEAGSAHPKKPDIKEPLQTNPLLPGQQERFISSALIAFSDPDSEPKPEKLETKTSSSALETIGRWFGWKKVEEVVTFNVKTVKTDIKPLRLMLEDIGFVQICGFLGMPWQKVSSAAELRKNYRKLLLTVHPDKAEQKDDEGHEYTKEQRNHMEQEYQRSFNDLTGYSEYLAENNLLPPHHRIKNLTERQEKYLESVYQWAVKDRGVFDRNLLIGKKYVKHGLTPEVWESLQGFIQTLDDYRHEAEQCVERAKRGQADLLAYARSVAGSKVLQIESDAEWPLDQIIASLEPLSLESGKRVAKYMQEVEADLAGLKRLAEKFYADLERRPSDQQKAVEKYFAAYPKRAPKKPNIKQAPAPIAQPEPELPSRASSASTPLHAPPGSLSFLEGQRAKTPDVDSSASRPDQDHTSLPPP